jgi:hypothetical protein
VSDSVAYVAVYADTSTLRFLKVILEVGGVREWKRRGGC